MNEHIQKSAMPAAIGAQLKKVRLEKGISLEDAHKKTKIHLDILRAIEEENFVNINLIYLKGFIKIYCGFLGEDPAAYLSALKEGPREFSKPKILFEEKKAESVKSKAQVQAQAQTQPQPVFRRPEPARAEPAAAVPLSPAPREQIVSRTANRSQREPTRRQRQESSPERAVERKLFLFKIMIGAALVISAAAILFGLVSLVRFTVSRISRRPAASAVRRETARQPAVRKEAVKAAPKKTAAAPTKAAPAAQAQAKGAESKLTVGINALEDCWVQAKVDGKVVFQGIVKRGRFELWEAQDKLELALGNAGAVRVEVNGAVQPPLGKRGEVLRGIVFNRGGGYKIGK